MSVQTKQYVVNPLTNRSVVIGGKAYKKLVRDGIIENKGFHKTPDEEVVRVINANNEEEVEKALQDDKLNKRAREIAQKILEKHLEFLRNECENEEDVIAHTRKILDEGGYLTDTDTVFDYDV